MEHVWDANADPFSNTIESHITNLRRKINLTGKKELIHTVSGRGYKVDIRK
jgi:DNA-binding response OmpR family regulator